MHEGADIRRTHPRSAGGVSRAVAHSLAAGNGADLRPVLQCVRQPGFKILRRALQGCAEGSELAAQGFLRQADCLTLTLTLTLSRRE